MKRPIGFLLFCMSYASVISLRQASLKYLRPGGFRDKNTRIPLNQYLAPQNEGDLHYKAVSGAINSPRFDHRLSNEPSSKIAATYIPIVRQEFTSDVSGNYNFGFETANGIQRLECGDVHKKADSVLNVQGSYSYTGDDGRTYTVNYKADENGFHAEGDHLPTLPPVHLQNVDRGYRIHDSSASISRDFQSTRKYAYSTFNRYLPSQRYYTKRYYARVQ